VRFLLDHDVPAAISRVLSQAEHDLHNLMDVMSPRTNDSGVFDHAIQHGRVLVTCNRDDFLTLAAGKDHLGS